MRFVMSSRIVRPVTSPRAGMAASTIDQHGVRRQARRAASGMRSVHGALCAQDGVGLPCVCQERAVARRIVREAACRTPARAGPSPSPVLARDGNDVVERQVGRLDDAARDPCLLMNGDARPARSSAASMARLVLVGEWHASRRRRTAPRRSPLRGFDRPVDADAAR